MKYVLVTSSPSLLSRYLYHKIEEVSMCVFWYAKKKIREAVKKNLRLRKINLKHNLITSYNKTKLREQVLCNLFKTQKQLKARNYITTKLYNNITLYNQFNIIHRIHTAGYSLGVGIWSYMKLSEMVQNNPLKMDVSCNYIFLPMSFEKKKNLCNARLCSAPKSVQL